MNLVALKFIGPVEQRISRYLLVLSTLHGLHRVENRLKNLQKVKIC
jgi:hypothetical protein